MDLEVSYIALRKIDLCEEKVFERLVLLVLMVSKRAINDIISCRTHWEWLTHPITENAYTYFRCLNIWSHHQHHRFKDTGDPISKRRLETETTLNFFLPCRLYSTTRTELLNDIHTPASSLTHYHDERFLNILLYGSEYFSVQTNQSVLKSTIKVLKSSERFDNPLFCKTNNMNFKLLLC